MRIDIQELAKRESERVEWKEQVADVEDVVRTAVAMSNDFSNLGGGYIVCGAKESKDAAGFQAVDFVGMTSARFKEVENHVLAHCRENVDPPIHPFIEEIATPDATRRILVFVVPATGHAHSYRSRGKDTSTYWVRIGRETREARNGLLRELLVTKRALDPWDRRVNGARTIEEVDLVTLREYLQTMDLWDSSKGLEDYLSADSQIATFVPPLAGKDPISQVLHPRNFTLLLFTSHPTKYFPGAYSVFSVYPGNDRADPTAERAEITGPVIEQARILIQKLNVEAYTAFDKTSPHPNQLKYPGRALQEAVVNAIVHRDYEADQPVRVTVFADRVEIFSPGALPRAVDRERFLSGRGSPYWRNQTLAYFFNKLQLAQAEGQGVPTIFRTMHEAGCPAPEFLLDAESVTCTLPAHPRHRKMRQMRAIENDIIVGNLDEAFARIRELLHDDPYNYRCLELFCEVCNLRGSQDEVFEFLKDKNVDSSEMNPACMIIVAETLLSLPQNEAARKMADRLLARAAAGRLEESEIKKVAVGIRKVGRDGKAIEFIDQAMSRIPALQNHPSLLEIRAKSRIELAKRCIDTAKNRNSSPRIKALAWDECRSYLEAAESDLNRALQHVAGGFEREFIERDLEFLQKMRQIAEKPRRTGHRRGSRG